MAVKNKNIRIVCVGANLESRVAIEGLWQVGAKIVALVTLPSNKQNEVCDYVDLSPWCEEQGIKVIETLDINSQNTLQEIKAQRPDYIFTLGWSQLFREEVLKIPLGFVVGSHPSPLPYGRGRAPVPWTILEGQNESAVTLFRMEIGVDSGDILCQKWFKIPDRVYATDLYDIVSVNLKEVYCDLFLSIKEDSVTTTPQDMSKATYRPKRTPEDGIIDFDSSAEEVDRLVRAVSRPYPGAFTYYESRKVHIWNAVPSDTLVSTGEIGEILNRVENKLLVQTGEGSVWIWNFTICGEEIPSETFAVGSQFRAKPQ